MFTWNSILAMLCGLGLHSHRLPSRDISKGHISQCCVLLSLSDVLLHSMLAVMTKRFWTKS